ncbi:hypothetical protein QO010_003779 [Caulobacter ginsengisoli]|uniref:Uncharacterized protein n=1 Tax=Caulobacter ginsengisoli TaxID=400775 RepID=A0ABU0IVE2_9CAUL|nr:hypothetical protein [Caulobacter ginsengisoli]MDQ0465986.1 hypothetical protein [Caulobacter ginsengisoli]
MLVFTLAMALLGQPPLQPAPACAAPVACLTPIAQPHPSVQDGAVLIGMNEVIVISLDEAGANPTLVATGDEAAKRALQPGELRFRMEGMGGTMLSVESKHGRWLNYRARMGLGGGRPTSVCTLGSGLSAFESWQQAIPYLTLDKFTPTQEGQMVCR